MDESSGAEDIRLDRDDSGVRIRALNEKTSRFSVTVQAKNKQTNKRHQDHLEI